MRRSILALSALMLPLLSLGAVAQEGERYRLEKTEQGYVRMDTQTGEMSICEERTSQLVCRVAADERSALQDEIDRLNTALQGLAQRVTVLEKAPAIRSLPTDEEVDKTIGYMQRFFRGFMDIVKDFEKNEDAPATPQKT